MVRTLGTGLTTFFTFAYANIREAIANAIILVGVGVAAFLPLAATSQQEQEFRYFRRMLLLWVQNFIIAFTVLLPVGYAIVSHKHRRVRGGICNDC